jgi:hypothetical protein
LSDHGDPYRLEFDTDNYVTCQKTVIFSLNTSNKNFNGVSPELSYSLILETQVLEKSGIDFEMTRSSLPKKRSLFLFSVKALNFI